MKTPSETPLLLDVNVLLALAWPSHQFHAVATRRLDDPEQRWSTCAITQLGFIRLSSNAAAVSTPVSPAGLRASGGNGARPVPHLLGPAGSANGLGLRFSPTLLVTSRLPMCTCWQLPGVIAPVF